MKKILSLLSIFTISSLNSLPIVSCSMTKNLEINVNQLDQNISSLLFKNVDLGINNLEDVILNKTDLLYWKNLSKNFNNFLSEVYEPNSKIIKSQYINFFSNLGYETSDISSKFDLLKYLQISINTKKGLGNLGIVFSGIKLNNNNDLDNIKISLSNVRIYLKFIDPINGINKEFYFLDSNNKFGLKNMNIIFPTPKNNINNIPFDNSYDYNQLQIYFHSKLQLLYLKIWFDWKLSPGNIENLIVAGTKLSNISNKKFGIKIAKYNVFNVFTTFLFGESIISSISIIRNSILIKSPTPETVLEKNDILVINTKFSFTQNLNYSINIQIKR